MTATTTVRQYESMFLFPQAVTADLEAAASHVTDSITRHGGTIVSMTKWDERRLAYDIRGNKRGVYFLCYFTAEPPSILAMERDFNLSEKLLRFLIMRADHLTPEQMQDAEGQAKLAMEAKLRRAPEGAEGTEGVEIVPPVIEE
jgi:small subunit ribosomal protein S6